jgi:hypothetical protein
MYKREKFLQEVSYIWVNISNNKLALLRLLYRY